MGSILCANACMGMFRSYRCFRYSDWSFDNRRMALGSFQIMTVYVDQLVEYPLGTVRGAERVKYWCHMFADSVEELHQMADKIGMRRAWFQGPPEHKFPHYDLSTTYRMHAIRNGAVEVEEITRDHLRKIGGYNL